MNKNNMQTMKKKLKKTIKALSQSHIKEKKKTVF